MGCCRHPGQTQPTHADGPRPIGPGSLDMSIVIRRLNTRPSSKIYSILLQHRGASRT